VVLRVAIGWHFGYEGIWKVESWQRGGTPFSAEGYLRNASGPLAPYFRGMVPDVNGLARLDPVRLKQAWSNDVQRIGGHYGFNEKQRSDAADMLAAAEKFAADWINVRENREKRAKYYHDLAAVQKLEKSPDAMPNEKEWAWSQRRTLQSDLKDLTKDIDARGKELRDGAIKLATTEQVDSAGGYKPAWTLVDANSTMTALSLVAIGACLIAGLFTRLAALGGAAFLALIYLCMPPWPGLPPNPLAEGHFMYVDKNLVELIALLALAALPTGHWVGLDALFFGWRRRRGEQQTQAAS
jgi:uncharacterized membrane protein YphA (DoxX/SURF4 family)